MKLNNSHRILGQAVGVSKVLLALVIASASLPLMAAPDTTEGRCDRLTKAIPAKVSLQANFHEVLALPMPLTRVAVAQPDIADVSVVGQDNLLILGKKPGATGLLLWSACSAKPMKVQVNVQGDSAQLTAQAGAVGELPSQVQVDIRFVEVSRTRLKEVGARFQMVSANRPNFFNSPNAGGAIGQPGSIGGQFGIPTVTDAFNILWGGNSRRFMGAIDLLEQSGYAYTLSRPSLVAMSGQTASFLAGGEVPIPVPQGVNGTITILFKEFGVRLALTPTIVNRQKIFLKVAPEVSDLDFSNALTLQGTVIPALRVRRADTTITMADGESFVIGGLISRSTISNADKMPGLGSIPILGAFFRSSHFESEDRELLMIVTPKLIQPIAANAELPTLPADELRTNNPSSASLFFMGDRQIDRDPSSGLSR